MDYRAILIRVSWVAIFCMALTYLCISQTRSYEQFTESDGLPSMTTYEIEQDSAGVIWVGTENGLVSYDGVTFTNHIYPNLKDNDMVQTFIHETGEVGFVNLANEIGLVRGDTCEIFEHEFWSKPLRLFSFRSGNFLLYENKQNDSVKTYQGLLTLEKGKANLWGYILDKRRINKKVDSLSLVDFINDDIDSISGNLTRTKVRYTEEFKLPVYDNYIKYIRGEFQGLIGTGFQYEPVQYDFIKNRNCTKLNFFSRHRSKYLFIDNHQIYSYDTITKQDELISEAFVYTYLFVDKEGVLWASTQNSGLIKFLDFDSGIKNISHFEKDIVDISRSENKLLVTSYNASILYDSGLRILDKIALKNNKRSVVFTEDNEFIILNGTGRVDVRMSKFKASRTYTNLGPKVAKIVGDSICFGTAKGLKTISKKESFFDNLDAHTELESTRIIDIIYDDQNNDLYIGTIDGLYIKENMGAIRSYCDTLSTISISSIVVLDDSSILVGTESEGVYHVRNGEVMDVISIEEGLRSNSINQLKVQDDNVAIATNKGVTLYNLNDQSIRNFGSFEGLSSNNVNSIEFLEDGSVLVGAGKSLVQLELESFEGARARSTLSIGKVLNNNIEVDPTAYSKFSHDQNKIEINLNHISQRSSDLAIRYRIKEIDNIWTTIKEPIIRLPALQPGSYSVEAIGINEIGEESNKVELSFTIHPPWWQTWWARLLGVMSIAGVMLSINEYRNRQRLNRERAERNYLVKINEVKEQALQLQMNPHFIFNSLNAIQNFIGTDEEEQAMNYLARFAKLIRLIFEYSKGSKISLEEELEFMKLYLELEKLRFKDKVDIEFQVSEAAEELSDMIEIPPLLIQPIVENSFKHGLFHKKGKGLLKLDYNVEGNTLIITVEDNGVGRNYKSGKTAMVYGEMEIAKQTSSGMKTTKERLELLNFDNDHSPNTIEVEDLLDIDNKPRGTKTIFRLDIGN